jgi:NADPH2:quinone reductase
VGGEAYARSTKCIAFEGRILIIGFASGQIPTATLNHALIKNYSIVGLHWNMYAKKEPQSLRDAHTQLTALVADGLIRPLVGERLRLGDVAAGLARLADGDVIGRLVFVP